MLQVSGIFWLDFLLEDPRSDKAPSLMDRGDLVSLMGCTLSTQFHESDRIGVTYLESNMGGTRPEYSREVKGWVVFFREVSISFETFEKRLKLIYPFYTHLVDSWNNGTIP